MKVNLAAQTMSSSVADAVEFCSTHLQMPQFKGSEATVRFIRILDRLFDILNSRNPFEKGYKSPMRKTNKTIWEPFFLECECYILQLKDTDGSLLVTSWRKTGFIGFLASIANVGSLF